MRRSRRTARRASRTPGASGCRRTSPRHGGTRASRGSARTGHTAPTSSGTSRPCSGSERDDDPFACVYYWVEYYIKAMRLLTDPKAQLEELQHQAAAAMFLHWATIVQFAPEIASGVQSSGAGGRAEGRGVPAPHDAGLPPGAGGPRRQRRRGRRNGEAPEHRRGVAAGSGGAAAGRARPRHA